MLQYYLQHKATEQKNNETNLKSVHTMKVLQIYNQENEKSRKIIELSNEILQETYFVLNGNMLITDAMREKFNQLYKVHDQRGVKFTESDEVFEISENLYQTDFPFDTDHLMVKDEFGLEDGLIGATKRQRDTGDDTDVVPTKKRVVRSIFDGQNLDATQVLATHDDPNNDDSNMNATFAIKPTLNKCPIKGTTPSRALKESNPNVHKGFAVPKQITKPVVTKFKSTLIAPQKENKRTPTHSKIRRSPRGGLADPLNRSEY